MLDDLKRAFGRTTQKEPIKVAQIKEAARNMGMNLDEYILYIGNVSNQQIQHFPSNVKEPSSEIQELRKEIESLKALTMPTPTTSTFAQMPIVPSPMVDQIKDIATIMTAFKEMFPQQNIKDIIELVKGVDELRAEASMEGAEPDMGMLALKELMPHIGTILQSRSPGKEPTPLPNESASSTAVTAAGGDSITSAPAPEVPMGKDLDKVKQQIKDKLPPDLKTAIRNGDLTLEQIKNQLEKGLKSKGYSTDLLPAGLVEEIYNEIQAEKNEEEDDS